MRRLLTTLRNALAGAALALIAAAPGAAQTYPDKPVRIIVDSAAGSANDATGRILVDRLSRLWGQQVIVLNQPGAGGSLAVRAASTSPADGYTLFMPATSSFLALKGAPGVAPNLPAELPRDFEAISFVLQQPLFIGSSLASPYRTVAQVIEAAKQKPGELSYAATGRGRLTHLTMELLQNRAGVRLQLVPYAGGPAQAMSDVMTGRVPLILDGFAGLAGAIQGGQIHGLASTSDKRLPGFDNLPVVAETLPDFFVGAWNVLLAPKGTPKAVIDKVNADMRVVLDDPDVRKRLAANGAFVRHMSPEEVVGFVQNEQKTWRPILEHVAKEAQK